MQYKKINRYQEIRVSSIDEIYDTIDAYEEFYKHKDTGSEEKIKCFYRGQSNYKWNIEPSLSRAKLDEYRILKKHKPKKDMSLFAIIAYIQHYPKANTGTRFIDFSFNPKVSLYFACVDDSNTDGALFLYSYAPHEVSWFTSKVIVELAEINGDEKISVKNFSKKLKTKYPEFKTQFCKENELEMHIMSFLDQGFMVLPDKECLENNLRAFRQEGCFFVSGVKFEKEIMPSNRFGNKAGYNEFFPHTVTPSSSWEKEGSLVKLIIPKEFKEEIIKKLNSEGITHSFLFPE